MINARDFDIITLEADEAFRELLEDFQRTWDGDRALWQDMEEQEQLQSMGTLGEAFPSEPEFQSPIS